MHIVAGKILKTFTVNEYAIARVIIMTLATANPTCEGHCALRCCAWAFWSGRSGNVRREANAKPYDTSTDHATTRRKHG